MPSETGTAEFLSHNDPSQREHPPMKGGNSIPTLAKQRVRLTRVPYTKLTEIGIGSSGG